MHTIYKNSQIFTRTLHWKIKVEFNHIQTIHSWRLGKKNTIIVKAWAIIDHHTVKHGVEICLKLTKYILRRRYESIDNIKKRSKSFFYLSIS